MKYVPHMLFIIVVFLLFGWLGIAILFAVGGYILAIGGAMAIIAGIYGVVRWMFNGDKKPVLTPEQQRKKQVASIMTKNGHRQRLDGSWEIMSETGQ